MCHKEKDYLAERRNNIYRQKITLFFINHFFFNYKSFFFVLIFHSFLSFSLISRLCHLFSFISVYFKIIYFLIYIECVFFRFCFSIFASLFDHENKLTFPIIFFKIMVSFFSLKLILFVCLDTSDDSFHLGHDLMIWFRCWRFLILLLFLLCVLLLLVLVPALQIWCWHKNQSRQNDKSPRGIKAVIIASISVTQ